MYFAVVNRAWTTFEPLSAFNYSILLSYVINVIVHVFVVFSKLTNIYRFQQVPVCQAGQKPSDDITTVTLIAVVFALSTSLCKLPKWNQLTNRISSYFLFSFVPGMLDRLLRFLSSFLFFAFLHQSCMHSIRLHLNFLFPFVSSSTISEQSFQSWQYLAAIVHPVKV